MRLLLVADLRSPHSVGWARGVLDLGIEPLIISSRQLSPAARSRLPLEVAASIIFEPTDLLSSTREGIVRSTPLLQAARAVMRRPTRDSGEAVVRRPRPEGTGPLEYRLESLIADRLSDAIGRWCARAKPRLVHALKIPFEGVAAGRATIDVPLAISVWGSDLVQQAPAHPGLAAASRRCLERASALHADCRRDITLARNSGFPRQAPTLVAAGNMGFDPRTFSAPPTGSRRCLVVMPRGRSSQINYQGFLDSVRVLHASWPEVQFIGVGLAADPTAQRVRAGLDDPSRLRLTGKLSQAEMAGLYAQAIAVVSPSTSDGTPLSLVEAMASGAIPLAGDIESLRELLGKRFPQSLFDPTSTESQVAAIRRVLEMDEVSWAEASHAAHREAMTRWSRDATQSRVERWYDAVLAGRD